MATASRRRGRKTPSTRLRSLGHAATAPTSSRDSKSKKRPPTSSGDGDDARRWRKCQIGASSGETRVHAIEASSTPSTRLLDGVKGRVKLKAHFHAEVLTWRWHRAWASSIVSPTNIQPVSKPCPFAGIVASRIKQSLVARGNFAFVTEGHMPFTACVTKPLSSFLATPRHLRSSTSVLPSR